MLPADPQQLLSLAHPSPFHSQKGGLWDSDGGHLSEVPENEVLTTPLPSGSSDTEEISDYSQYNDADEVRPAASWCRGSPACMPGGHGTLRAATSVLRSLYGARNSKSWAC